MTYHIEEDLPQVEGDAVQLRQVFMNLIMNASDAIGEQAGRIDVSVNTRWADRNVLNTFQGGESLRVGRYVEIRVADTGCGMSAETMSRVFEPFFSTKFTGRGLGLAAVNGIVRSHEGGVLIASTIGVGTTFTLVFPVHAGAPAAPILSRPRTRVDGRGRTILIVDDNAAIRESAKRILERSGFVTLVASDGVEALAILDEPSRSVSLLVTDMTMPRMGGLALLTTLRQRGSVMPVVLISGFAEAESSTLQKGDAHTAFVQKPFGIDALLASVGALLAQ
jgi:CheY-like chemotaxis protein